MIKNLSKIEYKPKEVNLTKKVKTSVVIDKLKITDKELNNNIEFYLRKYLGYYGDLYVSHGFLNMYEDEIEYSFVKDKCNLYRTCYKGVN